MKKLIIATAFLALIAMVGCHISNYPVIFDDRGDFSGVIRTGHRAYIQPTSQIATLWPDGSDELINMVFQSQNGDQKLFTKNNFDPTQSVLFVDQTYCDWRFETCVIAESWNPVSGPDEIFDYYWYTDCLGARSLSLLLSEGSRLGECGDGFAANMQALAGEFAELPTTTWRGGTAYVVGIHAGNTSIELQTDDYSGLMPIYGSFTGFLTEKFQFVLPVTPNLRPQLRYLQNYVAEHGNLLNANVSYNSLTASFELGVRPEGLATNLDRF